jgi:uncharacterized damage-inducible protein DinB
MIHDLDPIADVEPTLALELALLDGATKMWRSEFAEMEITEDVVVWQPSPGAHSIGALILHMIDCESFWIETVIGGKPRSDEELKLFLSEETDQYAFDWPAPPRKPLAWYLDLQDRYRQRTHETIRGIADPMRVVTRDEKRQLTVRAVLGRIVMHESYSGGQAVLLAVLYGKQARERST